MVRDGITIFPIAMSRQILCCRYGNGNLLTKRRFKGPVKTSNEMDGDTICNRNEKMTEECVHRMKKVRASESE